jgi:hypothetical protein
LRYLHALQLYALRAKTTTSNSGKHFVLLGATSAMGPLRLLLDLGASVIAIDINRPHVWSSLLALARSSSGTLTFPLSAEQSTLQDDAALAAAAGANLLTQTPEILDWLKGVFLKEPLVVGAYAYLDGELHVRVSLAMDAIIKVFVCAISFLALLITACCGQSKDRAVSLLVWRLVACREGIGGVCCAAAAPC